MKKITLTSAELSQLLDLYRSELDKAQKRVDHITGILKKLSAEGLAHAQDSETELHVFPEKEIKVKPVKKEKIAKIKTAKGPQIKETAKSIAKVAVKAKAKPSVKSIASEQPIVEKKTSTRGRKPKSVRKPIKKGTGKKKIKWNDFVLETIAKAEKPINSTQISKEAQEKFKISNSDFGRVKMVIAGTISKLLNADKKIKNHKVSGSRGKAYGLNEWFNEKGEILPQFTEKL
jgi:hypothetical protein